METTITLDLLTKNSVSVLTIITINYNGKMIEVEHTRKTYSNSILGRRELLQVRAERSAGQTACQVLLPHH